MNERRLLLIDNDLRMMQQIGKSQDRKIANSRYSQLLDITKATTYRITERLHDEGLIITSYHKGTIILELTTRGKEVLEQANKLDWMLR